MSSPATGLQRSSISFRRQGSSGLVWEDEKIISRELNQSNTKPADGHDQNHQLGITKEPRTAASSSTPVARIERNRSDGGRKWHSGNVLPVVDPPSPRVSGCGLCGILGKKEDGQNRRKEGRRRR